MDDDDDEKQPTRKQSIVRGSLGYHPSIRYPIFTKCRRMFAHVYRNAPLLYRPPGPHPGKAHNSTYSNPHASPPWTHLGFLLDVPRCAASNQFSSEIQAYLLPSIELRNERCDIKYNYNYRNYKMWNWGIIISNPFLFFFFFLFYFDR